MPLPEPVDDENRDQFIARCMADDEVINEFGSTSQRFNVCKSLWERAQLEEWIDSVAKGGVDEQEG